MTEEFQRLALQSKQFCRYDETHEHDVACMTLYCFNNNNNNNNNNKPCRD